MPRQVLQRGERAVRHEEAVPEERLDTQGVTEDRPERSAMGGDQDRLSLPYRRIEDTARTPFQRKEILPARGTLGPFPLRLAGPILREPRGRFRPGQPLPQTVVAFPKSRHLHDRNLPVLPSGDFLRRVGRPLQVARVDQVQRDIRQAAGQGLRLPSSPGIQGDVGLALDPVVLIPLGLAVANQINN